MYIEFTLPRELDVASVVHTYLSRNLLRWSERYQIAYHKKTINYIVKVTFDNDAYYDFFAMTWNPLEEEFRDYLADYRFIEPMRRVQ